ncbi:MAG: VCBS repeat-containing protein [Saprospiraceae bacterium]|nr:VCBS repeat-containing protein [Saprospiraceae bacterium]
MMVRFRTVCTFGVLLLISACKDAPKSNTSTSKTDGHQRMIAMLDSIFRNANPQDCYNLNGRKAGLIKEKLDTESGPTKNPNLQFKYADQLLNSGQVESATMELLDLVQSIQDTLTDQTKLIYEMLALSYMRLGEQQNCINSHAAESCIVPLQGGGIYRMKSGPENAIKVYKRLLARYPDDAQSRWLLNLAYMAIGKWPAEVPKNLLLPESIFKSPGNIRFNNVAIGAGVDARGISGGVCAEDFDGDNLIDLFVTSYGLKDQARFYHNNGDGSFSERTRDANLTGIVSGLNAIHADYDNDGDRDVLILRGGWLTGGTHPNSLLRNNGNGVFTDVTIESGLLSFHPTQAADWADYDGDGWLDLYIANETSNNQLLHPNELYHNNGDGTFTNVAKALGVDLLGFYKAAVWGDINNDLRPDLYLSNVSGENKLLVNRGGSAPDQWKFEDISAKAGVTNPIESFPAFFLDYDNDGFEDIFVSNFSIDLKVPTASPLILEYMGKQPAGDWFRVYHNNGDETFTDVHRSLGLHTITYAMGNNFGDLDNDGWMDFYLGTGRPDLRTVVPNRMFHNVDGKRFEDISMNGFSHIQKGHGIAFSDFDNDGDQDIYAVQGGAYEGDISNCILFENPGTPNHWITLFLEGKTSNKDAIGAKIKVNTIQKGGKKRAIYATVGTGGSFGSSSLRQEIGLGQAEQIESVEVQWPKQGIPTTTFTGFTLDTAYKLSEGNAQPEAVSLQPFKLKS